VTYGHDYLEPVEANMSDKDRSDPDHTQTSKTGVEVELIGEDGNAFSILGRCRKALRRAGQMEHWEAFQTEATSGNYDHLLCTVHEWFDVK